MLVAFAAGCSLPPPNDEPMWPMFQTLPRCEGDAGQPSNDVDITVLNEREIPFLDVHGDDDWEQAPKPVVCHGTPLDSRSFKVTTATPTQASWDIVRVPSGANFALKASTPRSPSYVKGELNLRVCKSGKTARFTVSCVGHLNHSQKGTTDVTIWRGDKYPGEELCYGFSSDVGDHALNSGKTFTTTSTDGMRTCQQLNIYTSTYVAPWNPGHAWDLKVAGSASHDVAVEIRVE